MGRNRQDSHVFRSTAATIREQIVQPSAPLQQPVAPAGQEREAKVPPQPKGASKLQQRTRISPSAPLEELEGHKVKREAEHVLFLLWLGSPFHLCRWLFLTLG